MNRSFSALLFILAFVAACDRQPAPHAGAKPDVTLASSDGPTTTLHFKVTGMHCDGCADGIRMKLATLPGVLSCETSFEKSSAMVTTNDPTIAKVVIETIHEMQYGAEEESAATASAAADTSSPESSPAPETAGKAGG